MIQWIIVAIVIAICLLMVCRHIYKRTQGSPCCNCGKTDCPARRGAKPKKR